MSDQHIGFVICGMGLNIEGSCGLFNIILYRGVVEKWDK